MTYYTLLEAGARALPIMLASAFLAASCSDDDGGGSSMGGAGGGGGAGGSVIEPCDILYGTPTDATGLTDAQCQPSCACGDKVFDAPVFDQAKLDDFKARTLSMPFAELASDPYAEPAPPPAPNDTVCAVVPEGVDAYRLETFASEAEATSAGGAVTHFGACGVCSTLQDLAVYVETPDLTEPVRACGVLALTEGDDVSLACIRDLGFTEPCAQVWFFNSRHTREQCLDVCLTLLSAPYHNEDGSLNECLLCDEEKSGPTFKSIAGRTRRNSGLASALCRPCDTVRPVAHDY